MSGVRAFRWRNGALDSIEDMDSVHRTDLVGLENQIEAAEKNIRSFVSGGAHLDMLLWGERGAGKSSIIKMLLTEYHEAGLRAVEFRQEDIDELHALNSTIRRDSKHYYIIYFDDISFDRNDVLFRRFKSVLEGGLEKRPANCMIVATSNMRHMVPDKAADTNDIYDRDEENEKISLKSRFAINIGFYPMRREPYLSIAEHYLKKFGLNIDDWQRLAENYAMDRGGRSGRIAKQFAVQMLLDRS
ncbi:DUF815 domain-containing protein [Geovibrio thiophilus]|uniref:DUF815 domain-containing protein n=1 Tax=Geovibrio thiophilus TaxID=139438 RepID=A0A3R6AWU4_9BACT|nr:DUF815 domain-containing protein [Geovibrio thiophilus]QAR32336.1 DUF815 domain-containing protein [Geovibrio thiophilus]